MMKKVIIFTLFLFCTITLFSVLEETGSLSGFIYGNAPECEYDNWMSHIVEGIADPGYNLYAPWDVQTNGFGNFVEADEESLEIWGTIIDFFLLGYLDVAQTTISNNAYPYQVVIFTDTDTDRIYHMLREIPNMAYYDNNLTEDPYDDEIGAFAYGWGLYIYSPDGETPHITTVVHPTDDYITVPIGHKAFVDQDSKALLISGCGREVLWTQIGNYANGKSLCDPSRVENHPYNIAYQRFCDQIRNDFQRHEFSLQIHSCDWGTRHWGSPDLQISGGYNVHAPDLPIRDHSSAKKDIVNIGEHIVIPANTVGMHSPVYVNDYFGFHCNTYDFTFSNADTSYTINTNIDLWGYSGNRQMVYTQSGMNHYDNFERFFHIEMDELPNGYPQTVNNYNWFNGWNVAQQKWNMNSKFDHVLAYYSYWVDALTEVLPYMYEMDDFEPPVPPSNLEVISECSNHIKIIWEIGDAYDVDTYEILYSNEPISNGNYNIIDRGDYSQLACLAHNYYQLNNLDAGQIYYFAIRIKDKNGNTSELSNEVMATTGPAYVYYYNVYGHDELSDIYWKATSDTTTGFSYDGFNIYRKSDNANYELLAGWETDPSLIGIAGQSIDYSFIDYSVENGGNYTYQVSIDDEEVEYFYGAELTSYPQKVFELVSLQTEGTVGDTCYFGYNQSATNGYDFSYDSFVSDSTSGEYFFSQFHENNWDPPIDQLNKSIKGNYDTNLQVKSWRYRIRTNLTNQEVEISIGNLDRNTERLYLERSGEMVDLTLDSFFFTPTNSDFYYFNLYLGNLVPDVDFAEFSNQLLYPNEIINFEWSLDFAPSINHINVYAENEDISIPIEMQLTPQVNQVTWLVPQLLFEDLSIKIDLVMQQGDTLHYYSPYKLGIISPQNIVQTHQGWNLITKNFDSSQYTSQEIFGEEATFYEYFDDDFTIIPEPEFLNAYWLFAEFDHLFTLSYSYMQRAAYGVELENGWNLLPNPHRAHYRIDQIQFAINNASYEYYEAVQNGLIEPAVFTFDDQFEPAYELNPAESYYLYCYVDGITANFVPYYSGEFTPVLEYDWTVNITAEQNDLQSSIIIGTSPAADSLYNPNCDLLKPLNVPFEENIIFSLPMNISGSQEPDLLHQSLTRLQDTSAGFEYVWNAQLQVVDNQIITFSSADFELPEEHNVFLIMPDMNLDLTNNEFVEYTPSGTLLEFTIVITNESLDADNNIVQNTFSALNYPNPFNPETTIRYNIPEDGKVRLTVYNIRGQKVKRLVNDQQTAGLHSIKWSGVDTNNKTVSSGVYFYKLETESKTLVNKMILLK